MGIVENKTEFEINLNNGYYNNDVLSNAFSEKLEIVSKPRRLWGKEILYYLSFGLYDKRAWKYKVKLIYKI